MAIDTTTFHLLNSVLRSRSTRDLFQTIATRRIAEKAPLKAANVDVDQELNALEEADLISPAASGEKYFVTANGLRVARDLEKIPR